LALGLLLRFAFQVAEHQRRPILRGQLFQFLVEHRQQLPPGRLKTRFGWAASGRPVFSLLAHLLLPLGFHGQAEGHGVQPPAYRFPLADRPCLASQQQKRGLQDVFSILHLSQHAPGHAQHHRPVAAQEGGKGRFFTAGGEVFQQLAVGNGLGGVRLHQPAQPAQDDAQGCVCHTVGSPEEVFSLYRADQRANLSLDLGK
jgi:hypothetical protein